MPKVLDFDVYVEVEGNKLPEFQEERDESSGTPVVSCWIPSEAGKAFSVVVVPPPPPRDVHWSNQLELDGISPKMRTEILWKDSQLSPFRLDELWMNESQLSGLRFSALQLTDDEALDPGSAARIGEIKLNLSSVEAYVQVGESGVTSDIKFSGRVHEKAKKGMAHCIATGEAREAPRSIWYRPVNKELVATVRFKYRNMDILMANGIAPRPQVAEVGSGTNPPSNAAAGPSKETKKRKSDEPKVKIEINLEEEIELDTEEKELEARLAAVRARKAQNPNKRIKAEVKEEPSPFVPGEVIDLTLD